MQPNDIPSIRDGFTAVKPTEPDVDDGRHNQHDQQPARTDNQRHEQTKVMNCRYLQATDNNSL